MEQIRPGMETGVTGVGWRPSASSISLSNMGEGTISTSSPYLSQRNTLLLSHPLLQLFLFVCLVLFLAGSYCQVLSLDRTKVHIRAWQPHN
ncbi:hypothetical protein GOODEAATRI_031786 [Goodea atripinnis]|uniref:Uncharacterized protein n=1 Tax=Goodea atripinnis TaxID=208336 RepID=A0ABV0P9B1_9TELE